MGNGKTEMEYSSSHNGNVRYFLLLKNCVFNSRSVGRVSGIKSIEEKRKFCFLETQPAYIVYKNYIPFRDHDESFVTRISMKLAIPRNFH